MKPPQKIAIIDWTHLIEDYLDNIRVSFDEFADKANGGWLFGYIQALQNTGFEPIFFCFSAEEKNLGIKVHTPTGAKICVLKSPYIYRILRAIILNPYAESPDQAAVNVPLPVRPFYSFLLGCAEYVSTPLLKLRRELKTQDIKIILSQEYESGRFDELVFLSKIIGRKIFAVFQGGSRSPGPLKRFFRRAALFSADGLIIGSGAEVKRVQGKYGINRNKIAKIFNPVAVDNLAIDKREARKKYGIEEDVCLAVWHGRIDLRRKGLDVMLEAWKLLEEKKPSFKPFLMLLGDGNQAREFRDLLEKKQLKNVRWIAEYTNDRRRINEFLLSGDVYLFASRHEGFPVAPLEAMSLGLPLLASDASGISDILEYGEECGGIIVSVEDSVALAENLEMLFSNETLRKNLGEKARLRIRNAFSVESAGEKLREFFEK